MFRILIVDDERIILNGIKMMIETDQELSFPKDIVTTTNVPTAMELLDSFCPDLILTDIRMPVMDGFDLIRFVREREFSSSIVILTSHADFQYAQQAIRFNVMDFILKPIDQAVLRQMILAAYTEKTKEEHSRLNAARMELRNMMLYDLSVQELMSDSELIGRVFPHMYFTVVVLGVPLLREDYKETLEKILEQYYDTCYCFLLQEKNQVIAVCNHDQYRVKPVSIHKDFETNTECADFFVGVSISANTYRSLHALYINALQRIFCRKQFGENSDLTNLSLFSYQDCVTIFNEKDESAERRLIKEYLLKIRAGADTSPLPDRIYQSFVHNIQLYLDDSDMNVPRHFSAASSQAENDEELMEEILSFLRHVKKKLFVAWDNDENDSVIRQLMKYIESHYREDVSLDDLAEHVGFHPNYVCMLFKKNTGESYLTCLHKERLYAAKKSLRETDYTIEQIAEEVGYNSASQFARVFRKYEGVSPSAFRTGAKD